MKPLQPASIPASEIAIIVKDLFRKFHEGDPAIKALFDEGTMEEITAMVMHSFSQEEIFKNDEYQVCRRKDNAIVHLSIKRLDRQPVHDWRDIQEIKNQLLGPECEAVELYPADSRVVDTANQYHLWGSPDPTFRFPFGFDQGRIVGESTIGKSVQRPFNQPTAKA